MTVNRSSNNSGGDNGSGYNSSSYDSNCDIVLPVTTASQSAYCDNAAISDGVSSFELMLRAGTAAAEIVLRDYGSSLYAGVAVFVGTGNNGGDGYVVAAQLLRAGVAVRVHATGEPRTEDAIRAAQLLSQSVLSSPPNGRELVVVDALLGTGSRGELRSEMKDATTAIAALKVRDATVVSLDIPTGLNADDGSCENGAVQADTTVCFGTMKRGLLINRSSCGRIVLVDIAVAKYAADVCNAWHLGDAATLCESLPAVEWNSYKTKRGIVAIVGGDEGMAGAAVLACNGALYSGAGKVHAWVHERSVQAVQSNVPQALAHIAVVGTAVANTAVSSAEVTQSRTALTVKAAAVGPGLGTGACAEELLYFWLNNRDCSLVLDADALTVIARLANDDHVSAASWLKRYSCDTRSIVCTPHAGEFERLTGCGRYAPLEERVKVAKQFAEQSGGTILLKGTPTVIISNVGLNVGSDIGSKVVSNVGANVSSNVGSGAGSAGSAVTVVARGNAALATGGSGDLLSGVVATLLAQQVGAHDAAAIGAWCHGRAAEIASQGSRSRRGIPLSDIAHSLIQAFAELEGARYPAQRDSSRAENVLLELPSVVLSSR